MTEINTPNSITPSSSPTLLTPTSRPTSPQLDPSSSPELEKIDAVRGNSLSFSNVSTTQIHGSTQIDTAVAHRVDTVSHKVMPALEQAIYLRNVKNEERVANQAMGSEFDRTIASLSDHQITHKNTDAGTVETATNGAVYKFEKQELARGKYKKVFKGEKTAPDQSTGRVIFAQSQRTLEKMTQDERNLFMNEIKLQWELKGRPGIMQLEHAVVYAGKHGSKIGLLVEFCDKGDLRNFIVNGNVGDKIEQSGQIFLDFFDGMVEMENAGIQHRDIKPDNLFLQSDGPQIRGKVGDLGLATKVKDTKLSERAVGSIDYMSPAFCRGRILYEKGASTLAEGNNLVLQGTSLLSENKDVGASMIARGQKKIAEGKRILEESQKLTDNTKNDLWSFGISMYELRKNNDVPACIPYNTATSIPDSSFLEKWLPSLEPHAKKDYEERVKQDTLDLKALQNEMRSLDPSSDTYTQLESKSKELEESIAYNKSIIDSGNCAWTYVFDSPNGYTYQNNLRAIDTLNDELLMMKEQLKELKPPDPEILKLKTQIAAKEEEIADLENNNQSLFPELGASFMVRWLSILPQEAVDHALSDELADPDRIETPLTAFNYQLLKVKNDDQVSAKELRDEYKKLKTEVDNKNASITTRNDIRQAAKEHISELMKQFDVNKDMTPDMVEDLKKEVSKLKTAITADQAESFKTLETAVNRLEAGSKPQSPTLAGISEALSVVTKNEFYQTFFEV